MNIGIVYKIASFNKSILFREATSSDKNFALITNALGCFSHLGLRNMGPQKVWLSTNGCTSYSTFVHEFLHAYGLNHEHERPDRDEYIEVLWDNIIKKWAYAYNKCKNCETYQVPYDGKSCMHYHPWGFSIGNGKLTMQSKVKKE